MTIKELYEAAVARGDENRTILIDSNPEEELYQVKFDDLYNADPLPNVFAPKSVIIKTYKEVEVKS